MDGENNVWIVKLNPSGGLLTEKEYKKWKNIRELEKVLEKKFTKEEIENYHEKYKNKEIANLCKNEGIIAIGWLLNPMDTWAKYPPETVINQEKFKELYKNTPWYKENKTKLNPSIKKFQELKEGDFCWVRDSSDKYYVCKIKGDWYYDNSKEAWAMDIAQRYDCKWVEVGDATEAPSEIVKKLITLGGTVSKIKDITLIDISNYLFENGGEKAVKKAVTEFNEGGYIVGDISIIDNLTQYEYEDFVGFYLQKKGYFIMPSTRYQSTEGYEFVAIKQNEKMVVQAKYYKEKSEKLDANESRYKNLSKTYTLYLACNNGIKNNDNDNNKIKQVKNSELEKFIRENPFLIPDRVKFLVVYTRNHSKT